VVVGIGEQRFAIAVQLVREIRGWSSFTPLPHAPDFVLGMINLRGLILPVVDLGARLGKGPTQIGPSAVVIVAEVANGQVGLLVDEVCDIIIGSIIKRRAAGTQYGLVVLAEGLVEAMGEKGLVDAMPKGEIERFGKVMRDEHGHLRLGEIEFGRLMKELLTQRLEKLGIKMSFIDKDLGYELRCADPIPFDAEYTRDLGYAAVKFLLSPEAKKYGAIISFVDGKMNPLPFEKMLDPKTGRMQNRKVNVDGEAFECACAYMIRLEREDFDDAKKLAKLAAVGVAAGAGSFKYYPPVRAAYCVVTLHPAPRANPIESDIRQGLSDNTQFFAGAEQTQIEFFHTFNVLFDAGKKIVISSDHPPKELHELEERLRSRFEWGLIADIQPPEIETKVAIVDKKAHENNISLPKNVAYYIASKAESNIRELEGFIIRIGAYASLTGREIDMDLVKEVLKKFFKQGEKPDVTVDEIMKTVAAKFNIRIADLKSHKKNKNLVIPRQIAMYLARKLTSHSFPDIGAKIGGKDHSTVIYANNKIRDLLEKDSKIEAAIKDIEETLNRS